MSVQAIRQVFQHVFNLRDNAINNKSDLVYEIYIKDETFRSNYRPTHTKSIVDSIERLDISTVEPQAKRKGQQL